MENWSIRNSLVEKYLVPPVVKFRMLVGCPDRPLDFREINIGIEGVPEYLKFRDEYERYMPPPGFREYMRKLARDFVNETDVNKIFGPEKDE